MTLKNSLPQIVTPKENEERQPLLANCGDSRKRSFRACKDLVVLTVAFWLIYTAATPTEMLQSSLNSEASLGIATLSTIASMNFFNSLSTKFIQTFTAKRTLLFGCTMHVIYITSNLYPRWWTILPAGCLMGFGGSLHWVASGHYVTMVTKIYADATDGDYNHLTSLFQGIFYVGYALGGTTGGIIASLVLQSGTHFKTANFTHDFILKTTSSFDTFLAGNLTSQKSCGVLGCPWNYDHEMSKAPKKTVQLLFAIFIAIDICALILIVTCLSTYKMDNAGVKEKFAETIKKTVRESCDPKLLLLVNCCVTGGVLQTFFTADFTQV